MKYEIIKGSEKDFDLAPDWATLKERNTSGDLFFSEGHSVGCRVQGITTEHDFTIDDGNNDFTHLTLIAERRPITDPVWDGEGLPPVGSKVMTKSGEGIIDYVGSGVIVYSNNDGQWSVRCDSLDYSLSAIRSPEDVAREKVTLNMLQYMYSSDETDYAQVCKIYDAIAANKIPGVKLE